MLDEFLSLVKIENFEERYKADIADGMFFGMPLAPIVEAERRLTSGKEKGLGYLSMEYGLATSFYNTFTSSLPKDSKNESEEQDIFSNFNLADYFFTLKLDGLIDLPIYSGGLGVLAGDCALEHRLFPPEILVQIRTVAAEDAVAGVHLSRAYPA